MLGRTMRERKVEMRENESTEREGGGGEGKAEPWKSLNEGNSGSGRQTVREGGRAPQPSQEQNMRQERRTKWEANKPAMPPAHFESRVFLQN